MDRPNQSYKGGKYAVLDIFCFAEFLAHYDVIYTKEEDANEYQPNAMPDDLIEENHDDPSYHKKIILMESKQKLQLCRVRKVMRHRVPRNRQVYPEKHAYHLLLLFYPFCTESKLLAGNPPSYCEKLNDIKCYFSYD